MRRVAALISVVVIVTALCSALGVTGSAYADPGPPPGVSVWVGYADNLRANPSAFPSPWDTGANVIFQGCHPLSSCTFDGGAVRVVNNTASPVNISDVALSVSSCVFQLWPGATLQPGQELIVTQTASGAGDGCPGPSPITGTSTMDTSDIGPGGAAWTNHCSDDQVKPTVSMNVDGVASTFKDSPEVLNTGGLDVATCPNGTNESTQWSLIGTDCPSATITLAPLDQSLYVPGPATVQATVRNSCGQPLQNNDVTFKVLSGPNAGFSGSGPTDASGVATFTYPGTTSGTDVLQASFSNPAGTVSSNTVHVDWLRRPTTLTYNGATTSDFNDPAPLSATLTDTATGAPIPGASIAFSLNGSETCTAPTGPSGTAECPVTPGEAPGTYPVTASYAGDTTFEPKSATTTFTVTIEQSAITSSTSLQLFAAGGSATVSSTLTDPDGGAPIPFKPVTMTLGSGSTAQSCTANTNATGTATCTISPVTVPLGPQPLTDAFAGDQFYQPASNGQHALVYGFSNGGSFVIGEQSRTNPVTFWGAQWAKTNILSGGAAPSAFKGFEDSPAAPGCGISWTTDPGNSTPPPAGPLPSYMAVIVASNVTKSGSSIAGNTTHVVIVRTDAGYAPNPGHAGTGDVVATIC